MLGDPMLTGTQIVTRLSEARSDTDLKLIYDIWSEQDHSNDVMRSSDHLAIRKAVAALDRVGNALARRLASDWTADYRTLPEITPTTRVRKTPRRLWLEIDITEPRGEWSARAVLFLEFSKKGVTFGIRLPTDGAPLGKHTNKALRQYFPTDPLPSRGWQLEHRKPPSEKQACSNDLNTWLREQTISNHRKTASLVLSKTSSGKRPLMKTLVEELTSASHLINEVMNADTRLPSHLPMLQEVICPAII
jgi:hypothetical protein